MPYTYQPSGANYCFYHEDGYPVCVGDGSKPSQKNNRYQKPHGVPILTKIKDKPKSSGSFEIPSAVKAAAAAKVAKAMKNLGGKTNVLNIPIMTKGSADKIFKDFFGKQDYSS